MQLPAILRARERIPAIAPDPNRPTAAVRSLDFLILAAVGLAGYAGWSGWWTLLAAAAMTVGGWWRKMTLLRQHPQVPLSSKMTTYLIASIAINVGFAAAVLVLGRAVRLLLGG